MDEPLPGARALLDTPGRVEATCPEPGRSGSAQLNADYQPMWVERDPAGSDGGAALSEWPL